MCRAQKPGLAYSRLAIWIRAIDLSNATIACSRAALSRGTNCSAIARTAATVTPSRWCCCPSCALPICWETVFSSAVVCGDTTPALPRKPVPWGQARNNSPVDTTALVIRAGLSSIVVTARIGISAGACGRDGTCSECCLTASATIVRSRAFDLSVPAEITFQIYRTAVAVLGAAGSSSSDGSTASKAIAGTGSYYPTGIIRGNRTLVKRLQCA